MTNEKEFDMNVTTEVELNLSGGKIEIVKSNLNIKNGVGDHSIEHILSADGSRYNKAEGDFSVALGQQGKAYGRGSISLGNSSKAGYTYEEWLSLKDLEDTEENHAAFLKDADNRYQVAIGQSTKALGKDSFAGGMSAIAKGKFSLSFGESTEANAYDSSAFGYYTKADGSYSAAFGKSTNSIGEDSFAIGEYSVAEGKDSFAGGLSTITKGRVSFAFGDTAQANNTATISVGQSTKASGDYSAAFNHGTLSEGISSFAINEQSQAKGDHSFAGGEQSIAEGKNSFAFGIISKATGECSIAIGNGSTASGKYGIALGNKAVVSSVDGVAIGYKATCTGEQSVALSNSSVSGKYSLVFGPGSYATQDDSIMLGRANGSNNPSTIGIGQYNNLNSPKTVAIGFNNTVSGQNNVAIGIGLTARNDFGNEILLGQYSKYKWVSSSKPVEERALLTIGNGTSSSNRSNALELSQGGNLWVAGKMTVSADPVEDNDVTTKKYVDEKITEVSGNSITIDSELSETSENPVQNGVITKALSERYTNNKVDDIVSAALQSAYTLIDAKIDKTSIDAELSDSSGNPVQNKVIKEAFDGKVEKKELNPAFDTQVYAETKSGTSSVTSLVSVGETPYAGRLIRFRSVNTNAPLVNGYTGTVLVSTPKYDAQAANKYYVDTNFSKKLYKHNIFLPAFYNDEHSAIHIAFSLYCSKSRTELGFSGNDGETITGAQFKNFLLTYFRNNEGISCPVTTMRGLPLFFYSRDEGNVALNYVTYETVESDYVEGGYLTQVVKTITTLDEERDYIVYINTVEI